MSFLSDGALIRLREAATWPDAGDRYRVVGVIGRGGAATVYEAEDRLLERHVALKVADVADRAGRAAARLAREAVILARLDHPGIVPIHERGTLADGRPFYVMKLVRGRRLDAAAATLPELFARVALVERVLETVTFAHAQGIVHRDLTPANILTGSYGEVFVMDWGAAQSEAVPDGEAVITGTPGFMPPEQVEGKPVDARADIFALGAILRTLAGDDPPRPLVSIIARATAAVPADRYADAAALADDLRRFRSGLPASAHHERVGERLLRTYRRFELPIVLVLAYVLMRAVLLVWRGI